MLETKFIIDIFIVIFTDCWTAGPSLPRLCILVRAIPAQMIPMFRIDSVLTNSQAPSCTHNSCSCACIGTDKAETDVCSSFLHAPAEAASGAVITEVTSASMSMSLGHGVTVAAAVMTTGGNADSALAEVLDRVVPAPTSRWAAMIEEAPVRVSFASLILHPDFASLFCILILHPDSASRFCILTLHATHKQMGCHDQRGSC